MISLRDEVELEFLDAPHRPFKLLTRAGGRMADPEPEGELSDGSSYAARSSERSAPAQGSPRKRGAVSAGF